MKRRGFALFCALTLFLTGCTRNQDNSNVSSSNISDSSATENTVQIPNTSDSDSVSGIANDADVSPIQITYDTESKTYTSDDKQTDILKTDYSSPTVTINGNADAADTIMDSLTDEKKTFYDSMSTYLSDANAFLQEDPDTFSAFYISSSYETERCDEQIISLRSLVSDFTGGVHGNYSYAAVNFDTKTGKTLKLGDIASDKTALLDSARDYINSLLELPYYAQSLLSSLEESQDMIDQYILTDGNWYFTNAGLTFISNVYVLSPYAAGAYFFTVPYQKLDGLKAEYQYTGSFEAIAPVGSTLSADINGDESVDAIYYDVNYDSDTGNLSCTLTINGTDFSSMLQNDDCSLTEGAASCYGLNYYLIDLDTSDNSIELALQDQRMNDDYVTYFFRYDGRSLQYLGSIGDLLSNAGCKSNGDGTLTTNIRLRLLETAFATATYQLTGDGTLELVSQDWYYLNDSNQQDKNKYHNILNDVTVHTDASQNADTVTLTPSDGPVSFPATDNEHWVMVKMQDDTLYYLYLEDFSTLESGQNVSDVFENLIVAD